MTKPKPYRYRTADESKVAGYLAKRFKAFRRLQRMQAAAKSDVVPIKRTGRP